MKLQPVAFVLGISLAVVFAKEVRVEPAIFKTLEGTGTVNVFVSFKNKISNKRVASQVSTGNYATRADRVNAVFHALKDHAQSTQATVLNSLLKNRRSLTSSTEISSFWITNQIFIKNADPDIINQLSIMDQVAEVVEEEIYDIEKTVESPPLAKGKNKVKVQWGVENIGAPTAWSQGYRGAGVVVAIIDTGVRGTHEALKDNFREENGWFDPIDSTAAPNDQHGHGTHVTGTILGRSRGIGVAPDAKWIACKGCNSTGKCPRSALTLCAQYTLCPTNSQGTNQNCNLAPHIVSNSLTMSRENNNTSFDDAIIAWKSAGIIIIFACGNKGPSCGSIQAPGTHPDAIGVGAIDDLNQVAGYSSRGPSTRYRTMQPDVAAPGSKVYSASHISDGDYTEKSGTSMACPHVAGLAALLKSASMDLNAAQIRKLIVSGAQPATPLRQSCGGINDTLYPNNYVGHGRISVNASFDALTALKSTAVTLKLHDFFALLIMFVVAS